MSQHRNRLGLTLTLLLCCLWAVPASATIADSTRGCSNLNTGTGSTINCNFASVAAGSLIIATMRWEATDATPTMSDGTTSFTCLTRIVGSTDPVYHRMCYLLSSVASGTVTYTWTIGATVSYIVMYVHEFTHDSAVTLGNVPSGSGVGGTGTAVNCGAFSTANNGDLSIAGQGAYGASVSTLYSIGGTTTGVANDETNPYSQIWWKVVASAGSAVAELVLGGSSSWACSSISFTEGGAAASGAWRSLLGVGK